MPHNFRFVRAEADIHELRSRSEGGIGGVKRQSQELKVNCEAAKRNRDTWHKKEEKNAFFWRPTESERRTTAAAAAKKKKTGKLSVVQCYLYFLETATWNVSLVSRNTEIFCSTKSFFFLRPRRKSFRWWSKRCMTSKWKRRVRCRNIFKKSISQKTLLKK